MRYFIIVIFLKFIFFCSFVAKANILSPEIPSQLENAERAIWKIYSSNENGNGTGFFIGPNQFVTNFHVIDPLLHELSDENMFRKDTSQGNELIDQNIDHIVYLSQENNTSVLKVTKVLAVSALYDLALLETKENVTDYLSFKEDTLKSNKNLFVIGYPEGIFRVMSKTGDILFYEDIQMYYFPTNHSSLPGASGSPVLDEQGLVFGVASLAVVNILGLIKAIYLKEFITGNVGMICSNFQLVRDCIEEEIQNLKSLAEEGSVYAQHQLAVYYDSKGIEQEAFYWMKQAAEQGFFLAQHRLVRMYQLQLGDFSEEIFNLYQKAAKQGFAMAQHRLAKRYKRGAGVEQDLNQAFYWMKQAAKQGLTFAQHDLAFMYHNGEGIEKDLSQAFYWFEKAAKQEFSLAQYKLALMYRNGEGVEPDREKAFYWLKKAAENDYSVAQYKLALMYRNGEGVESDREKALYWLKKAAENYHAVAQYELARIYYKSKGSLRNWNKAFHWCQKAADQGYPPARTLLYFIERDLKFQRGKNRRGR